MTTNNDNNRANVVIAAENPLKQMLLEYVGNKYATEEDARATCNKVLNIGKSFARKMQILTVMEQRSRFGKKPKQAAIARSCKTKLRKKYGKEKT